jgi:hypothetical protein
MLTASRSTSRHSPSEVVGSRLSIIVGRSIVVLLTGYMLLDRGFAYVHIPKTPLFGGEIVLGMGVLLLLIATPRLRAALSGSPAYGVLLAFMIWCAWRMANYLPRYGIDSIRDSSLWYYAIFAMVVATLLEWRPDLIGSIVRWYTRAIPWLYLFVAVRLAWSFNPGILPTINAPDSSISLWTFKPGNLAVQCAISLAVLWLVPLPEAVQRRRWLYTGVGLLLIGAVGTQNRGGMLAALLGLAIAWLLTRDRMKIVVLAIAVVICAVTVAWAANLKVTASSGRSLSVPQLISNVSSLTGSSGGDSNSTQLQDTVKWRDQLWQKSIATMVHEGKVLDGLGFGRNLGQDLGFVSGNSTELRSPHNSHIDILVRTGVVGAILWGLVWLVWLPTVFLGRKRYLPGSLQRGILDVCLAGSVAILANAYFDPTLESPQVALWLWSMYGFALWLVARAHRQEDTVLETSGRRSTDVRSIDVHSASKS